MTTLHDVTWVISGEKTIETFCEAYGKGDKMEDHEFNKSTLCCLPKKKTGTDDTRGDYFDASSTRPLCIMNTDNRIIASAARMKSEPILGDCVGLIQRGFLKGRSMLGNI